MGSRPVPQNSEYTLHEFFADEFPCALLMPAEMVTAIHESGDSIVSIAAHFGVPATAAKWWLRPLERQPN